MTSFQWGPEMTPKTILKLIVITCITALFAALTEPVFAQIFGIPGLQTWLSLSWFGIHNYLFWQPLSYIFVENGGAQGITLSFLLSLAFDMYILWILGSDLLNAAGSKSFLLFYFLSSLTAALAALMMMGFIGQYPIIAGPAAPLLAIFTVWTFLHSEAEIWIFFIFPVKAKWLFAAVITAILLVNISQLEWIYLTLYLSSILFGYLYAVLVWGFKGPFAFTEKFDRLLMKMGNYLHTKQEIANPSKIFDFKTGKPLMSDDEFIDAMLAKISRKGESSLTRSERKRMEEISEKKRKNSKKF